jgi:hypothetical protein
MLFSSRTAKVLILRSGRRKSWTRPSATKSPESCRDQHQSCRRRHLSAEPAGIAGRNSNAVDSRRGNQGEAAGERAGAPFGARGRWELRHLFGHRARDLLRGFHGGMRRIDGRGHRSGLLARTRLLPAEGACIASTTGIRSAFPGFLHQTFGYRIDEEGDGSVLMARVGDV